MGAKAKRTYLVVVDDSAESRVALRFAARRAAKTGGKIEVLGIVEPQDFVQFGGVQAAIEEEQRLRIEGVVSAAIGEIAIRHRITGPNLCFVGSSQDVLPEAADSIRRGEADACVCVYANVISPALAAFIRRPLTARACALFMQPGENGLHLWQENDRDMEALCATLRPIISTK